MAFGFKYLCEPEEQLEETTDLVEGNCIFCGVGTDLVVEHDNVIRLFVPVCKKHFSKFKEKEKLVVRMVEAIKEFVTS